MPKLTDFASVIMGKNLGRTLGACPITTNLPAHVDRASVHSQKRKMLFLFYGVSESQNIK